MTDAANPLRCPLPNCGTELFLTWNLAYGLHDGDLDAATGNTINPDSAVTSTWKVECQTGHVLLRPTGAGCGCNCDCLCECDVDGTDDYRTFRTSDKRRLREMLHLLAGGTAAVTR